MSGQVNFMLLRIRCTMGWILRTSSNAVGMTADAMGDADRRMTSSMAATAGSSPYFTDKGNYMNDRLKGNSKQT